MKRGLVGTGLSLVFVLLCVGQGGAGNGWNPPPERPEDESKMRRVGTEFFKLSGQVYLLLSAVESGSASRTKEAAQEVTQQLPVSLRECSSMQAYVAEKPSVQAAYKEFKAAYAAKTAELVKWGVVRAGDPVWSTLADTDSSKLGSLCSATVKDVEDRFERVREQLDKGQPPSKLSVWRLMEAVEKGSKESRYFTIVLQPQRIPQMFERP